MEKNVLKYPKYPKILPQKKCEYPKILPQKKCGNHEEGPWNVHLNVG